MFLRATFVRAVLRLLAILGDRRLACDIANTGWGGGATLVGEPGRHEVDTEALLVGYCGFLGPPFAPLARDLAMHVIPPGTTLEIALLRRLVNDVIVLGDEDRHRHVFPARKLRLILRDNPIDAFATLFAEHDGELQLEGDLIEAPMIFLAADLITLPFVVRLREKFHAPPCGDFDGGDIPRILRDTLAMVGLMPEVIAM